MGPHDPVEADDLAADPMVQLRRWIDESPLDRPFDRVATFCTTDPSGRPRPRLVPVRDLTDGALVVHTTLDSAKGEDILERPEAVSVLFSWVTQLRQIRVDGSAEVMDDAANDAAFAARPRAAQLRAWSGPGGVPVASRSEIEQVVEDVAARFEDRDVLRPPGWVVVRVVPERVEVFQGALDALSDRFLYEPDGAGWSLTRLSP